MNDQAGTLDTADWMKQLFALNRWCASRSIYDTEEQFSAARKAACLERHGAGRGVWNAWARNMLAHREALEKAGGWEARKWAMGYFEPANDETRAWLAFAETDFSGYSFKNGADFEGFVFPGVARFSGATFSGDAQFSDATFSGAAWFDDTTFSEEGEVAISECAWFKNATFLGTSHFSNAIFSCAAWFNSATFSGTAWFNRATFSGDAVFSDATFSEGADFTVAKFSEGDFFRTTFSDTTNFRWATFLGKACFNNTRFSRIAVFDMATFSWGASFVNTVFEGRTSFDEAEFKSTADFSAMHGKSVFSLANVSFVQEVPNFIQAHFAEAPRLDNVFVKRLGFWRSIFGAHQPDLIARYRALKRLAIQAHDHQRELSFFAGELKAMRGVEDQIIPWFWKNGEKRHFGWPGGARYWFGISYEVVSDFGRSIWRPLLAWGLSTGLLAWAYLAEHFARARPPYGLSVGDWLSSALGLRATDPPPLRGLDMDCSPLWAAVQLSLRKGLIVLGGESAEKVNQVYACLYGVDKTYAAALNTSERSPAIPDSIAVLGMGQTLVSAVLIFLFLLAVRNYFRIK
jgi:uncharacterized protein YjbI with pentapeptide repeats